MFAMTGLLSIMLTNKKILALAVLLSVAAPLLGARTKDIPQEPFDKRHEVRLGIGDMAFETMIWHDNLHKSYVGGEAGFVNTEKVDYHYTPHFSAEYSFHVVKWLSVGAIVDFQSTSWKRQGYNNHDEFVSTTRENFFNLTVLPTLRFNYVRRPHFGVYSSLSFGIGLNGGSEVNGFGKHTVTCPAGEIRLLGFKGGSGHWWGFAEFGALASLQNPNIIYMLGSELFRAGVSYKF